MENAINSLRLTDKSLRTIVADERQLLTAQKWDEVFSFENLIQPRFEP